MKHKLLPKKQYYFVLIAYQGVFGYLRHIPIYFKRFPKTTEYIRRCSRRNPKMFKEQIRIDNAKRL